MAQPQNFKGDSTELKMRASAEPVFDLVKFSQDEFYEGGSNADPFLLMLYDEGRMPFSQRIDRSVFVSFIRQALQNFPFTGSFESYLLILREIFGAESEILFEVPAPGKLTISINAAADVEFEAVAREFISGAYEFFGFQTMDGDDLLFRGIAGIETEYELGLLFSEVMPAGIFPSIALEFFSKSIFIGEDDSGEFDLLDSFDNQIVFIEIGG